jgi:hypothetical protein
MKTVNIDDNTRRDLIEILEDYVNTGKIKSSYCESKAREIKWRLQNEKGQKQS